VLKQIASVGLISGNLQKIRVTKISDSIVQSVFCRYSCCYCWQWSFYTFDWVFCVLLQ